MSTFLSKIIIRLSDDLVVVIRKIDRTWLTGAVVESMKINNKYTLDHHKTAIYHCLKSMASGLTLYKNLAERLVPAHKHELIINNDV